MPTIAPDRVDSSERGRERGRILMPLVCVPTSHAFGSARSRVRSDSERECRAQSRRESICHGRKLLAELGRVSVVAVQGEEAWHAGKELPTAFTS